MVTAATDGQRWAMTATLFRPRTRTVRQLLVAVAVAAFSATVVLAVPGLARLAGTDFALQPAPPAGLPACQLAQVDAPRAAYTDWAETQLDTANRLPADYEPPDLTTRQLPAGRVRLRAFVMDDLAAMLDAAAADGASITITSSYRSFARQSTIFRELAAVQGRDQAVEWAARPGHSEHQLGTTLDLAGGRDWLTANAWRFGFLMSYPAGRSPAWTCYASEPWHYRYFGRGRAAEIHASGLSPREWLWQLHSADRAAR
jgi:zinc D-Ala-D-Ala carboxypeptidase